MTDVFTPIKRSMIMSRIRSRDTTPERRVRDVMHSLRFKFREYESSLPGKPDIALTRRKIALFVHGCFWHQHRGCSRQFLPKSNRNYWIPKLERNVARYKEVRSSLRKMGWQDIVIWECKTKDREKLREELMSTIRGMGDRRTKYGI
jgi:DNA mismatch endonuclease (patch repair protein)